jgi:hypothetical protein
LLAGAALPCLVSAASASTVLPAATITATEYFNNVESTNLGWEFTVNSPVRVTALGYYDYTADSPQPVLFCCSADNRTSGGLLDSHEVGIFTTSGTLLASGLVPAGTSGTLINDFRYVSIASLSLGAGTYVIGATQEGSGGANPTDPVVFSFSSFATIPQVSVVGGVYTGAGTPGTLTFPGTSPSGYTAYMGPNFLVGTVPETSTWAMMLLGFAGLGFAAYCRTSATGRTAGA